MNRLRRLPATVYPMRRTGLFLLLLGGLIAVASPSLAETVESDIVFIRADDRVVEDLYAIGNRVEIAGVVEGDVVAAAAGEVLISGTIEGDLTVVASSVVINGTVNGSVRAFTRSLSIPLGRVSDDVLVFAWDVDTEGEIGRDLLLWAWAADVSGEVGRRLDGQVRSMMLSATVDEDVDVSTKRVTVGDRAIVGGDLRYSADTGAGVSSSASIEGHLIRRTPPAVNIRIRGALLFVMVLGWLLMVATGLAVLWAVPASTVAAAQRIKTRPVVVGLTGIVVIMVPFALTGVAALLFTSVSPEAALPLGVAAAPVLAGLFGLLLLTLLVAPIPVCIWLGSHALPGRSNHARLLLGAVMVGLVAVLPWFGIAAMAATSVLGVGAWLTRARPSPAGVDDRSEHEEST